MAAEGQAGQVATVVDDGIIAQGSDGLLISERETIPLEDLVPLRDPKRPPLPSVIDLAAPPRRAQN
jgi:hypothetical protein